MAKKNGVIKKEIKNNYPNPEKNIGTDRILVENFVSLQKVMTNLAVKFDNLSNQISRLLELFEISAKTLAEKDYSKKEDNKRVIEKLDALLEHNKIIAKGIALLHERATPEEEQEEVVIIPPVQPHAQPITPAAMPIQKAVIPKPQPINPQSSGRIIETGKEYSKPSQEFPRPKYSEE
jgi:hypothetical protein